MSGYASGLIAGQSKPIPKTFLWDLSLCQKLYAAREGEVFVIGPVFHKVYKIQGFGFSLLCSYGGI